MSGRPGRPRPYRALAAGGVLAAVALAALSVHVVAENRGRSRALADALFHEDARTALWQMEMRVATMLGAISYEAEVEAPPAGVSGTDWILACGINPYGNSVAEPTPQSAEVASNVTRWADAAFEGVQPLEPAEEALSSADDNWSRSITERAAPRSIEDFNRRQVSNQMVQQIVPSSQSQVVVGPLATFWSEEPGELALYLTRRIERAGGARYETFFVDWGRLEEVLLGAVEGLFEGARMVPIRDGDPPVEDAMRLAAVPVRLEVDRPEYAASVSRAYVLPLMGAWLGLLVALAAGWMGLRRSIAYGDKHRRFTQAVTHELRTPLTTFRMYSEMLRMGMVPEESRDEYLGTLESESERLVTLVDNVLRYARLEEGQEPPPRSMVTVAELCEGAERAAAPAARRLGARLRVDLPTDVGARTLVTDPDAVGQVLAGLLDNAFKYGHAAGIGAEVTLGAATLPGGHLAFDVSDRGPGIPAERRSCAFEPFDRAGRDSADPSPGVGLGLALARRLAEQLGGRLEVQGRDEGACFRLILPAGGDGAA